MLVEVVPIDFARSGVEGIVDVSLFGPGLEVKQHLLIRVGLIGLVDGFVFAHFRAYAIRPYSFPAENDSLLDENLSSNHIN